MRGGLVIFVLFALSTHGYSNPMQKRSSICYHRVGCFTSGAPFFSPSRLVNFLPTTPEKLGTKYYLFTRANRHTGQPLDAINPDDYVTKWPQLDVNKPTKFIVHGFLDGVRVNPWLNETKDELLVYGDFNVIQVDWSNGNLPPYTQATANTRLVGAQIADLINTLKDKLHLRPESVHIIGHSLGAHIAGYAGERITVLGRISGLDPAGPYFDGTDNKVRLDETDAKFVDVIHTDASSQGLAFGTSTVSGHVDFFPNLGRGQPGCDVSPLDQISQHGLLTGVEEATACNHLRAIKFFQESINDACPFIAVPCANDVMFESGRCSSCATVRCSRMGFHADNVQPATPTKFYLTTDGNAPFCQYQLEISVHMASKLGTERGELILQVVGSTGTSEWLTLNTDYQDFSGGHTYTFLTKYHNGFGEIKQTRLKFIHHSPLTNPLEWNILGLRRPRVFVDKITLTKQEENVQVRFCESSMSIETEHTETLSTKC